ncbi:MAG: c-type cytochrome domain-containing protein [Bacteroidota bacterium]
MKVVIPGVGVLLFLAAGIPAGDAQDGGKKNLTYSKDVSPIIKTYCLPCHLAENENPSNLALDSYETLLKGGKNGVSVIPGKAAESNLYLKLLPEPPFGRQMPRGRKKPTEDDIKIIHDWIDQGAVKE